MHGNTIKAPSGLKTRSFDSIRVILTWTCLFLLELVDSIRVMHGNTIKAPSRLMMYALPYYHPQDLSLFSHLVVFKLMYSLDVFYGYRLNWGHSLMSTSKKEATLEVFIWKWPGRMWQNVLEAHGLLLSMTWVHATTLTVILGLMLLNLLSLHLLLQRDCVREGLNQLHLCLPHSQFREKGFLHCLLDHKY
jgi:hypothetical protein